MRPQIIHIANDHQLHRYPLRNVRVIQIERPFRFGLRHVVLASLVCSWITFQATRAYVQHEYTTGNPGMVLEVRK